MELQNTHWVFRLPSHIGPRYNKKEELGDLGKLFEELFKDKLQKREFFAGVKWDFEVDLQTTEDLGEFNLTGEAYTTKIINSRHVVMKFDEPK